VIEAAKSAAPINMNVSGEIGLLSAGVNKVESGRAAGIRCHYSVCDEIMWQQQCDKGFGHCATLTVTKG